MQSYDAVAELVRRCTVVVSGRDQPGPWTARGSGFFISPGLILTCAHVAAMHTEVAITWCGDANPQLVTVAGCVPPLAMARPLAKAKRTVDFPDVALLEIPELAGRHPCVPIVEGAPALGQSWLSVHGVTAVRTGHPEADSSLLRYIGPAGGPTTQLFKLGDGFLASGQSGAAVLDLDRGGVCGIAKSELNKAGQDGGHAVPLTDALDAFPTIDLRGLNQATHDGSLAALRAQQGDLERFVQDVKDRLKASIPVLLTELGRVSVTPPATVAADDLSEWVTRQLFRLPLEDLVEVLIASQDQFAPAEFAAVRDATVCCASYTGDDAAKVWLPDGMVSMVRAEWPLEQPRLVHVASQSETTRFLLLRAFGKPMPLIGPLPASGEPHEESGLPSDLVRAVDAQLTRSLKLDKGVTWSGVRPVQRTTGRGLCFVLAVDHLTDGPLLERLQAWYPGLRFIASGRLESAGEPLEQVLQLRPDLDVDVELDALAIIGRSMDVA